MPIRKYRRLERCSSCRELTLTAKTHAFGVVCQPCNETLRRELRKSNIGAHGRVGKYWNDERNALLTKIYHSATVAECERAFPGKTINALYQQARLLGIHEKGVRIHRKREHQSLDVTPKEQRVIASYRVASDDVDAINAADRRMLAVITRRTRTW